MAKIIGGWQDGPHQCRVVMLEEGDLPGKFIIFEAEITGDRGEEGIYAQVREFGKDKPMEDPVERGENPLKPWVREVPYAVFDSGQGGPAIGNQQTGEGQIANPGGPIPMDTARPWGLMGQPHACVKCGNQNPDDLAGYYGHSGTGYQPYCRPGHGCDKTEVKA